jgi:hypothetical protein
MGDICMHISPYGQPDIEFSIKYENIVSGSFQPSGKALPQCKDVDVASISASIYAVNPEPTGNSTRPGNTRDPFSTETASQSSASPTGTSMSSGLGTGSIIGIAIGVFFLLAFVGGCIKGFTKSSQSSSSPPPLRHLGSIYGPA